MNFQNISQSILSLLYPPLCLHCQEVLDDLSKILCFSCQELLELLNQKDRCPFCFSAEFLSSKKVCGKCVKNPPILDRTASCFEFFGPAKTIIEKMKNSNQPYLTLGISAFMLTQFYRLNWPKPDLIIPVPQSITGWLSRGYNQSELIAIELGKYFNTPVKLALHKKSLGFRQSSLTRKNRKELSANSFQIIENQNLEDKNLLIVDDILYSGATLNAAASTLLEKFPKAIFGLTFCMED